MSAPDPVCDWCGSTARKIGEASGMLLGVADTWLCNRPGCGHEFEVVRHSNCPIREVRVRNG